MSSIADRLRDVQARVERACERVQRKPDSVTLIAVSKTRSLDEIQQASSAGQRHFGENRVQELVAKVEGGMPRGSVLHLIGTLQRNKARAAVGAADVIHSVDSEPLLRRLDGVAERSVPVLLQVDLAHEASKHGVDEREVTTLCAAADELERVRVVGLMLLPPYDPDPERSRPWFVRLRELRDHLGGAERLPELSMGMSHDFEVAIEEGATMVRVGQAIFGARVRRSEAPLREVAP